MAKKQSVQELLGIRSFTTYGIDTTRGELLFFSVAPSNLSVLSHDNIEIKIRRLMMLLSAIPDIEIVCMDSSECFDDNKRYLNDRIISESNEKIRKLLAEDVSYLDNVQLEMSSARQFMFSIRIKDKKQKQTFDTMNRIEKTISDQGFEVKRMGKDDIKRFLAIYFGASLYGEQLPDADGEQYFDKMNE